MATKHRYAATIRASLNGADPGPLELIYFESKCKDLNQTEAAAIIQANTNAAIKGSGKKYHITCTDLKLCKQKKGK